jgi:cytosine deaminase
MDLMTRFEEKERNSQRISKLTLFTSLEPCPMCFSRLITSGIQKVYYAAKDEKGGMVHLHGNMPETWRDLMKSKQFSVADCSNPLKKIALDIFLSTAAELDGKLKRLQRVSE